MGQSVKRVSLPSGGWWEIVTRPRWRHVQQWDADGRDQNGGGLVERALVSLTAAWSFGEGVSLEALARRDAQDMIAVLDTLQRDIVPFLEADTPEETAEELFTGLVAGRVPLRFAEVHMMAATGWSWQTLQETPADVVRRMAIYLAVKQTRDGRASLEFHDTEDVEDGP